jgi:hypothetical protein
MIGFARGPKGKIKYDRHMSIIVVQDLIKLFFFFGFKWQNEQNEQKKRNSKFRMK